MRIEELTTEKLAAYIDGTANIENGRTMTLIRGKIKTVDISEGVLKLKLIRVKRFDFTLKKWILSPELYECDMRLMNSKIADWETESTKRMRLLDISNNRLRLFSTATGDDLTLFLL